MILRDSKTTIVVDSLEGELINESYEHRIVQKVKAEDFVQLYIKDLSALMNVGSIAEFKVLMAIWKFASFNQENDDSGNIIILVKNIKEKIAKETGLTIGTISKTIAILHSKKLILKQDRSVYIMNPKYFFKGYYKDRFKTIKATIEYQIE